MAKPPAAAVPDRAAEPVEELTGAQSLVRSLENVGADTVFGIPGGAILPAYDPLYDSPKVRHILVRHEQGAGHAAEGYAMVTGKVGVCMATSGPGATNLVTPIADAHMDSVPIVAITGQVPSAAIGTDAFQEADIRGITMPITKHSFLVTKAHDIAPAMAAAFHIARTGRPGRCWWTSPRMRCRPELASSGRARSTCPAIARSSNRTPNRSARRQRLIADSRRPVLYVGGGVVKATAGRSWPNLLS